MGRVVGLNQDEATTTIFYNEGSNFDDLRFPAQGINPAGSTAPATPDTDDGCLLFDKTTANIITGVAQMPHCKKLGSPICPHIHWQGTTTPSGANTDVYWRFEHQKADINGSFSGTWVASNKTATVNTDPQKHQLTGFDDIDMSGEAGVSSVIKWRLTRVANDAADNYGYNAKLLEVDFHYEIDSVGSGKEYSK